MTNLLSAMRQLDLVTILFAVLCLLLSGSIIYLTYENYLLWLQVRH